MLMRCMMQSRLLAGFAADAHMLMMQSSHWGWVSAGCQEESMLMHMILMTHSPPAGWVGC